MRTQDGPLIVAFGGGVDSTAMLIEMHKRAIRPDLILFANTGGERPDTYAHLIAFDRWLRARDFPGIQIVQAQRRNGSTHTLEESCLRLKQLPSLAFGGHSCSLRFKRDPQDKFVNNWEPARATWQAGRRCIKAIGYDAGEGRRTFRAGEADDKYGFWYPLMDWGLGREDCLNIIERSGVAVPRKSSCFFCPAMRRTEIAQLREEQPELLERALAIEETWRTSDHEKRTTKGLGRRFGWSNALAEIDAARATLPLWDTEDTRVAA